jgi:prostaglandin-H2 D-isomerase / glutathione transferase
MDAPKRTYYKVRMSKPKLTYFDMAVSRGEECRLALHVAGIDFEDHRIKREEWPAMKPTTPYGSLPILEMPGQPALAHSNAILVLIGRLHGLHPADLHAAARHEGMMAHVEDMRAQITPSLRMSDETQKKAAREQLAATTLPVWAAAVEKQLGDGPFFDGAAISVVDFKLYTAVKWIQSGALDHIPANLFASYSKLSRLYEAVHNHPKVQAWYSQVR